MAKGDRQRPDERQLVNAGYRYAISLTHDEHTAADLIQQACLKVLKARGELVGKRYLFVAVRNLFYDQLRSHRTHTTIDESMADRSADHTTRVDSRLDVEQILAALRIEEREALFLNLVEGYTADEIGTLTGQPRSTVLSLLSRGKQRLAARYGSHQMMETK